MKTLLVTCDFCGDETENPSFDQETIGDGKTYFAGLRDSFICNECVDVAFEIYQQRCEKYYAQTN